MSHFLYYSSEKNLLYVHVDDVHVDLTIVAEKPDFATGFCHLGNRNSHSQQTQNHVFFSAVEAQLRRSLSNKRQ